MTNNNTKNVKDIDLSKIFEEESSISKEGASEAPVKNVLLNDNSHMHGAGKEHVAKDAGKDLTEKDIQNFTDPNTFKTDDNRDPTIAFYCRECKYFTEERPVEKKSGSYNFICPKCKSERMSFGTKTSIKNQYKII